MKTFLLSADTTNGVQEVTEIPADSVVLSAEDFCSKYFCSNLDTLKNETIYAKVSKDIYNKIEGEYGIY